MTWNVSDIPSLSSKVVLITGANAGIGFHAARYFCKNDAQVIIACRSEQKMSKAAEEIRTEFPQARLIEMILDLSDLNSVREFAQKFEKKNIAKIDVLVLNAGVALTEYRESKQGLEMMFATNHLGHWLLTGLLIKYIKDVEDSRIVVVSSLGHRQTNSIQYDISTGKDRDCFNSLQVYCASKLANQWFTRVLQHKLEDARAKTVAVAVHPGGSSTNLARHVENGSFFLKLYMSIVENFQQTAEQGSWPILFAATDPHVKKENYYGPNGWLEMTGAPIPNATRNKAVFDIEKARELWRISEDITEFRYCI